MCSCIALHPTLHTSIFIIFPLQKKVPSANHGGWKAVCKEVLCGVLEPTMDDIKGLKALCMENNLAFCTYGKRPSSDLGGELCLIRQ